MDTKENRTSRIVIGLVLLLLVSVFVEGYMLADMHRALKNIQPANKEPSKAKVQVSPSGENITADPKKKNAGPLPGDSFSDNWFKSPFDARRWNPFEEMQRLQDRINDMFGQSIDRFNQSPLFEGLSRQSDFNPRLDIKEENDRYVVRADLPGVEKMNVNVKLEDQVLTISGNRDETKEEKDSNGKTIRKERRSGRFLRSVTLEKPVDSAAMTSAFKGGVLTIIIPKS